MHPNARLVVPLLCVAITTCNGDTLAFDISQTIPEQVIPGDPVANASALAIAPGPDGGLSLHFTASVSPVSIDGIASLGLKTLQLGITSTHEPAGDTDCWDFLYSAAVSIESTLEGTSLAPAPVASVSQPGCTRTLTFTPGGGLDLLPYAREGFRVVIDVTGVPPADDVSFDGRVVMRAGVL